MNYLLTQELWNKLVAYLLQQPSDQVGDLVVELKALLTVNVVPQEAANPAEVQPAEQEVQEAVVESASSEPEETVS